MSKCYASYIAISLEMLKLCFIYNVNHLFSYFSKKINHSCMHLLFYINLTAVATVPYPGDHCTATVCTVATFLKIFENQFFFI